MSNSSEWWIQISATFVLLVVGGQEAIAQYDCYQSFQVEDDNYVETGLMSMSCATYEQQRHDLYVSTEFDENIERVNTKIARVLETSERTKQQWASEVIDETVAEIQVAIDLVESVDETADAVDDCLRAVQAAKKGNASKVIRELAECVDEINEADEATQNLIDSMAEEDTREVLRKSSQDLIVRLRDLQSELESTKALHMANRNKFFEMCAVVKENCLGEVDKCAREIDDLSDVPSDIRKKQEFFSDPQVIAHYGAECSLRWQMVFKCYELGGKAAAELRKSEDKTTSGSTSLTCDNLKEIRKSCEEYREEAQSTCEDSPEIPLG